MTEHERDLREKHREVNPVAGSVAGCVQTIWVCPTCESENTEDGIAKPGDIVVCYHCKRRWQIKE